MPCLCRANGSREGHVVLLLGSDMQAVMQSMKKLKPDSVGFSMHSVYAAGDIVPAEIRYGSRAERLDETMSRAWNLAGTNVSAFVEMSTRDLLEGAPRGTIRVLGYTPFQKILNGAQTSQEALAAFDHFLDSFQGSVQKTPKTLQYITPKMVDSVLSRFQKLQGSNMSQNEELRQKIFHEMKMNHSTQGIHIEPHVEADVVVDPSNADAAAAKIAHYMHKFYGYQMLGDPRFEGGVQGTNAKKAEKKIPKSQAEEEAEKLRSVTANPEMARLLRKMYGYEMIGDPRFEGSNFQGTDAFNANAPDSKNVDADFAIKALGLSGKYAEEAKNAQKVERKAEEKANPSLEQALAKLVKKMGTEEPVKAGSNLKRQSKKAKQTKKGRKSRSKSRSSSRSKSGSSSRRRSSSKRSRSSRSKSSRGRRSKSSKSSRGRSSRSRSSRGRSSRSRSSRSRSSRSRSSRSSRSRSRSSSSRHGHKGHRRSRSGSRRHHRHHRRGGSSYRLEAKHKKRAGSNYGYPLDGLTGRVTSQSSKAAHQAILDIGAAAYINQDAVSAAVPAALRTGLSHAVVAPAARAAVAASARGAGLHSVQMAAVAAAIAAESGRQFKF